MIAVALAGRDHQREAEYQEAITVVARSSLTDSRSFDKSSRVFFDKYSYLFFALSFSLWYPPVLSLLCSVLPQTVPVPFSWFHDCASFCSPCLNLSLVLRCPQSCPHHAIHSRKTCCLCSQYYFSINPKTSFCSQITLRPNTDQTKIY